LLEFYHSVLCNNIFIASNDSWQISNEISDSYLGKTTQNEFIQLLSKEVLEKILSVQALGPPQMG